MKEDDIVENKQKVDKPKKPWSKPTLQVFGDVGQLTHSSCDPNNPYNNGSPGNPYNWCS